MSEMEKMENKIFYIRNDDARSQECASEGLVFKYNITILKGKSKDLVNMSLFYYQKNVPSDIDEC